MKPSAAQHILSRLTYVSSLFLGLVGFVGATEPDDPVTLAVILMKAGLILAAVGLYKLSQRLWEPREEKHLKA